MKFRGTFYHPFKSDIIEIGEIEKTEIMENFEKIPWRKLLEKMASTEESEIEFSPTLEIENMDNENGLSVCLIAEDDWDIIYKRPKMVKRLFGLLPEKLKDDYLTEIIGNSTDEVKECLRALVNDDLEFLENKVK